MQVLVHLVLATPTLPTLPLVKHPFLHVRFALLAIMDPLRTLEVPYQVHALSLPHAQSAGMQKLVLLQIPTQMLAYLVLQATQRLRSEEPPSV